MASIDGVGAAVEAVSAKLDEVTAALGTARTAGSELASELSALNADGRAAQARAVVDDIDGESAEAAAFKSRMEAIRAAVEALRGSLTTVTGGTGVDPVRTAPPRPVTPDRRVQLAGFRPGQVHPDAVRDVKERVGYPRNAEGRTSARGVLYDPNGTPVNVKPFAPYRKGEQPFRPELTAAFNDPDHTTTAWHAEADAAQAIRDESLSESTLYLNTPLCGKKAPDSQYPHPHKCYANFRHTIPEGITAYVVVVPERGTPYRLKVFGTGEGISHDG